jgi:hypothetical protein
MQYYKRFSSIFKKTIYLLVVGVAVYSLERFCHKETDGFTISKIRKTTDKAPSHPALLKNSDLLFTLLNQPFSYLGRGGQCYAFASEDGKYILKLLKYNNHYPRIWFSLVPFPFGLEKFRQNKLSCKRKRLKEEYASYAIAQKELHNETGIFYFHLEKNTLPPLSLHIIDKLGIHHHLPADNYQFYIQKKGLPFYASLEKLLKEKGEASVKHVLDEFVDYLFIRCQKNITDGDTGIRRNFAFDGEHPFQIDIGQFAYDPSLHSPEAQKNHILFFTRGFCNWLENLNSSLSQYLIQKIEDKYKPCEEPI